MGQALSSFTECLGALGGGHSRYGRVGPRRVEAANTTSAPAGASAAPPASGAGTVRRRLPPPPPPLVPDKAMVYDLLDNEEEDVCPTCLENYSADNPQIVAECGHAFHLQCIVEWETRSGSTYCPICAKPMQYKEKGAPVKPV